MSIGRNSTYNLLGALVPLAIMFSTVPLYLEQIGIQRYGILAIFGVLLGYFSLFDLGLGLAVTNQVAKQARSDRDNIGQIFWTALITNFAMGMLGGVVLWLAGNFFFGHVMTASEELRHESLVALPLLAIGFPFVLTASIPHGMLAGQERFLSLNWLRVSEGAWLQLAPLSVAYLISTNLKALVATVVLVKICHCAIGLVLCSTSIKQLHVPRWSLAQLVFLIKYGGWLTVTNLVGPLLVTFDRLVIGALAGVAAVSHYTVPHGLAGRLSIIPRSLCGAIFPRLSAADHEERTYLTQTALSVLACVATPLALVGILITRPFLVLWLGEEFATASAPIAETIALGVWANCFAIVPNTLLLSVGRPDIPAKIHLAELVPYFVAMVSFTVWLGPLGAAIAWTLRNVADSILHFNFSKLGISNELLFHMLLLLAVYFFVIFFRSLNFEYLIFRGLLLMAALFLLKNSLSFALQLAANRLLSKPA